MINHYHTVFIKSNDFCNTLSSRKSARWLLRERREFYRNDYLNTPEPIIIASPHILWINRLMDPRYQIFISSTFRDLEIERQAVLDAVLELGHFPAGMEVFPAASATPWDLIQKIISESDYYVLIIGGRYGSTDENGVSYTELEYNLANEMGIPTLVFLPADPMAIPAGKVEMEAAAQARLAVFRKKAQGHHCKYWKSAEDLQSKVILGLSHEIRVTPRVGWIRANEGDSPATLKKLADLLEQNTALTQELSQLRQSSIREFPSEKRFAHEDEEFEIRYKVNHEIQHAIGMTWKTLFRLLAPLLVIKNDQSILIQKLLQHFVAPNKLALFDPWNPFSCPTSINEDDWQKVVLQFLALEYWEYVESTRKRSSITARVGTSPLRIAVPGYKLTPLGIRRLAESVAMVKD